jgi:hypothetical protein
MEEYEMKLFVGETQLCSEVKEWSIEKFGYIDHIMLVYDEKDDNDKYIDEIIKGPFIVHHVDMDDSLVTFARVDPDDEYVPDGFAVTITKNILSRVKDVCININGTDIHLFPHTYQINPEIFKMWENCENDHSEMYLKYHDPVSDKNMLVHVANMFTRCMIIDYVSDLGYNKDRLPRSEDHFDLDVEVIVW